MVISLFKTYQIGFIQNCQLYVVFCTCVLQCVYNALCETLCNYSKMNGWVIFVWFMMRCVCSIFVLLFICWCQVYQLKCVLLCFVLFCNLSILYAHFQAKLFYLVNKTQCRKIHNTVWCYCIFEGFMKGLMNMWWSSIYFVMVNYGL